MRKTAFIHAAVLAAGIICASPAHALPITHWEGNSPDGGMIVVGRLPIHAETTLVDGNLHMTAANGCDETWTNIGPDNDVGNNTVSGFWAITVNAGRGLGCQPTPGGSGGAASVMIHHDGANYTMTVVQTPMAGSDPGVSWVLHGHDG
jgi:hypothetical protein